MRRSALFVAAGAWALLPVPVLADPMNDAVYATAKEAALGASVPWLINGGAGNAVVTAFDAAIKALNVCGGGSSTSGTWATVLRCVLPSGSTVQDGTCTALYCGGGFDGGGASGSWTEDCRLSWNILSNGDLLVPTVKLKTGGPLPKVASPQLSASKYFRTTALSSNNTAVIADSVEAMALRAFHNYNMNLGGSQQYWVGVYKINKSVGTYSYSRPSSYNGSNAVARMSASANFQSGQTYVDHYTGNASAVDCPASTVTGGTSDYYVQRIGTGTETCIMYSPNAALSSSGYAYPDQAVWPASDLVTFPTGRDDLGDCAIDKNVIKRIVEKAFENAGYSVPVNQVKYGPTAPTSKDLASSPNQGPTDPAETQDPSPAPVPTPTPTSSPTGSSTTNVTLDLGPAGSETLKSDSNFTPPEWSWWPSMPSISIGTSAECPTYQFSAFDMQFTLDAHCTFIEQYRTLIAALMIIVFTIAAARVVLEA